MKGPVLAVLLMFGLATTALAQLSFEDKMAIKETVAKWNSSLHITTIPQLNNLYASSVFSYGKYRTRDACIKEKSAAVNEFAGFHQEIITPIEITCYESGTFKCSFTKRVRYKESVQESPSYLLLQKVDNRFQITGESDLKTDSALNVKLDLGEASVADRNGHMDDGKIANSITKLCTSKNKGLSLTRQSARDSDSETWNEKRTGEKT
jgi:hypothetical protein